MPARIEVKKGDKYGRLTIISEVEKVDGKRYFFCVCDCGKFGNYRFVALRAGEIKSCGCLRNEQNATASLSHGMSKTGLYSSWHCMKQRCLNPKTKAYQHYGGRGITIFSEWLKFEPFEKWALENGYKDGLTLEREKVDGNYEPGNCAWITMPEQNWNKRNNVFVEFNGERLCVQDWANKLGIPHNTMTKRLKNWPIEKALTEPVSFKHRRNGA